MKKLSLLDKIRILITVSKESYWTFIILLLLIVVGIVFIKTNKRNTQRNKKIYIIFSSFIGIAVLMIYQSSIQHLLNYLMDNLFISILFPNFAVYFLGIVITNMILWISIFHFKTADMIKRINVIVYIVLNYLLVLIIKVTDIQKIDVFSTESLYHSEKATALIELSTLIFTLWILFLGIYKIILGYLRKDYKENVKKVVIKQPIKKLPENYQPTITPEYIFGNPGKRVTLINSNPNQLIQNYENHLTVEDYQLVLKILKEAKEKKKSTKIELGKEQILAMKRQEKMQEEEKYTELEMLYRGIR